MTPLLKQSTSVVISFGPCVDKTDGVTNETGLVSALDHASTGIKLSKNGGVLAVRNATVTATTYDADGYYRVTLDTTDSGTLGHLRVEYADPTTLLHVWRDFMVVSANVYDALIAASDKLDVNAAEAGGTTWGSGAITAASLAADAGGEIADAVWDEVLTGATHNVTNSSGRRLRTASGGQLDAGTAQAGGADSLTLATSASTTAGLYVGCMLAIDGGTGEGQSRYIVGYTAARVAYVARHWTVTPDVTSTYVLYADNQVLFVHMGLAQAGAASTITLDAGASAVNDIYVGQAVRILSGTGDDQIRMITAYNGTTKVATVDRAWATNPDSTSYFGTMTVGPAYLETLPAAVDTTLSAAHGAGTWGSGLTGSRTITLQTRTSLAAAIPEVSITVRDSGDTTTLDVKTTNGSGNATLSCDDGTYTLRIRKAGYTWTTPATLVVAGDATETITGTAIAVSAPSAGGCMVYGYVQDLGLTAENGLELTFRSLTKQAVGGVIISGRELTATANGSGYFEQELPQGATANLYEPTSHLDITFTVPATATYDVSAEV